MRKYKKTTSLIVVFSMIFTLMNFTLVSATNSPQDVKINFVTSYIVDHDTDADTVEIGINIKSENTTTFGSINAMLQYDSDIIVPIPWSATGSIDDIYKAAYDTKNAKDWSSNILIGTKSPDEYTASGGYVFDKIVSGNGTGYLNLHAESQIPTILNKETRVVTARFGFKPGKSIYDIAGDTVAFAADSEISGHSNSSIEYFTGSETYRFNDRLGNTPQDMLIPVTNNVFAKPVPGDTVNTGGSGGGGPSGPTDPSDFVALNIYDWDDSKITTQVAPKGEDVSALMPKSKPLPGYIFAGWTSRMTPQLDANGDPVLGDDGNPVMVRNQSTPNVVTGAPGVEYPAELLVDVTAITENMDLIPAYDEDAGVISDSAANRRYTISREPFIEDTVTNEMLTTVTVKRNDKTRRINHNNGTVTLKVGYNTDGKGNTTVFIEGGATDEEKIDVIVSKDAKVNYSSQAVSLMVYDYRTEKSRGISIGNTECEIGK